MTDHITRLILVGGFSGAGKTTLLKEAAQRLTVRGQRVALLANDQAADLVDTAVLKEAGAAVDEVAGGCFCCRFPDMMAAIDRLRRKARAALHSCRAGGKLHRPIGHGASATEANARRGDRPVAVLGADRRQASPRVAPAPPSGRWRERGISRRSTVHLPQANRRGRRAGGQQGRPRVACGVDRNPRNARRPLSRYADRGGFVLTGEGVDAWLELLDANRLPGGKIVEVDYDVYAAGEAALGWMNARAELRTTAAVDWSDFAHRLLETIRDRVVCSGGQIGHLKLYLSVPGQGHVAGNATANDSPIAIAGSLPPNVREASLLLKRASPHPCRSTPGDRGGRAANDCRRALC